MTPPGLPLSVCIQYSVQRLEGGGCWVTLDHPAELAQALPRQFAPHDWPGYAGHTVSELLWAVLPELGRRLHSPESWRSRRLLLPPQQSAAEALSFRLVSGAPLPRTFSVPEVRAEDFVPPLSPPSGVARLLSWLTQRSAPAPAAAAPAPLPLVGTQAKLLQCEAVVTLQEQLAANRAQAEQSDDPRWRYHAKVALTEYLPETVRLHAERGGAPDDPEFLTALAQIHAIAHTRQAESEQRWQAHQRFLEEKAREFS